MPIISPILVPRLVALAIVSAWSPRESSARQTTSPSPDLSTANPTKEDFAEQIDIGGGRKLYLECHGTGSPTVILESAYHDSSQPWSLSDGYPPAVLPGTAAFTKVCAYDPPGTLLYTNPPRITDRSTPVLMPRTAQDVASDLWSLIHWVGCLCASTLRLGPTKLRASSWSTLFQPNYQCCWDRGGQHTGTS
jgi:hypothetical protein